MGLFRKTLGKKDNYFDGIVLLLSSYRNVDPQMARRIMHDVGREAEVRPDGALVVAGPMFRFNILSIPAPYLAGGMTREGLAAKTGEMRLKRAIMSHEAFVSLFVDGETPPEQRSESAIVAASFAGFLTDETTLAIWETNAGRMIVPTEENVEALRRGDRQAGFDMTWDAMSAVSATDLSQEMEEARRRFPEFATAFREATDKNPFGVKFPFTDRSGEKTEHMWVQPTEIDGTVVKGVLLGSPVGLMSIREGDTVERDASELSDWIYVSNGRQLGGFTEAKVRAALKR